MTHVLRTSRSLFLLIFVAFSFQSTLSAMRANSSSRRSHLYRPYSMYGGYGYGYGGERESTLMSAATAMETLQDVMDKYSGAPDEASEEEIRAMSDKDRNSYYAKKALRQAQNSLVKQMLAASKNPELADVLLRGMLGEDYELIDTLSMRGDEGTSFGMKALVGLGYGGAFKGAKVLGKRLEDAIDDAVGDSVSNGLVALSEYTGRFFSSIWRVISGRSGVPFEYRDVRNVKDSINARLVDLEKLAKNSGMLGGRDRILRAADGEDEAVDPAWEWQRTLLEIDLRATAFELAEHLSYYESGRSMFKKDVDGKIVLYTNQICDWINQFVDNVLLKTNSHKDLGTMTNQSALTMLKTMLERNFGNLLMHIAPKSAARSDVAETKTYSRRTRRSTEDDGYYNYS